ISSFLSIYVLCYGLHRGFLSLRLTLIACLKEILVMLFAMNFQRLAWSVVLRFLSSVILIIQNYQQFLSVSNFLINMEVILLVFFFVSIRQLDTNYSNILGEEWRPPLPSPENRTGFLGPPLLSSENKARSVRGGSIKGLGWFRDHLKAQIIGCEDFQGPPKSGQWWRGRVAAAQIFWLPAKPEEKKKTIYFLNGILGHDVTWSIK
ncbi:hypothetical protein DVH24_005130, partial [Malus domestica]